MDIKIINPIPREDIDEIINALEECDWFRFELIGLGSESCVYKYKNYAIKYADDINDPKILECFQDNLLFPKLYFYGENFMVTEYLEITNAYEYYERNVDINISAIDVYKYCFKRGYVPYDIHDQNVVVTSDDKLKIIDVGCFQRVFSNNDLKYYVSKETSQFIELDNIINHVKRPPIAI